MTGLAGVLLAAGSSSRLGDRSKQMLDIDGEPLVRRQAALLTQCCERVFVVTGADAPRVEAALEGLAVRCVRNEDWPTGMGGSLAEGVRAAESSAALLVLLADQWRVDAADLAGLCALAREHPGLPVAARWTGCSAGVPAIFPSSLFDRLSKLAGDRGARKVLADPGLDVLAVDMPSAAFDLDTPQDLEALEAGKG